MSRQDRLQTIIQQKYHIIRKSPNLSTTLGSQYREEIGQVYEHLSLEPLTSYPANGRYDIATPDFIVELDEERHFNRYRAQTLNSELYSELHRFPLNQYKRFCFQFEQQCLRAAGWGNNWHTEPSDRQFGKSNSQRDLSGDGSSRWKQRAFYDYLKDVTQLVTNKPLTRVSIYDKLEVNGAEKTIDDILQASDYLNYGYAVIDLILERLEEF